MQFFLYFPVILFHGRILLVRPPYLYLGRVSTALEYGWASDWPVVRLGLIDGVAPLCERAENIRSQIFPVFLIFPNSPPPPMIIL